MTSPTYESLDTRLRTVETKQAACGARQEEKWDTVKNELAEIKVLLSSSLIVTKKQIVGIFTAIITAALAAVGIGVSI